MKTHYATFQPAPTGDSSTRSWSNVRGYGRMQLQKQTTLSQAPPTTTHFPHALLQPLADEADYLNLASISRHAPMPSYLQPPACCVGNVPSNHHCMRLLRPKGDAPVDAEQQQ